MSTYLPPFTGATEWLNSPPLTTEQLRGNVVLVNFWTYTCINWLRTLPYIRAWYEKYADSGFTVIGVHTPEFPFEHDVENVRQAAADMEVTYPIAIDNDYEIWRAFANHYWPALYFIDALGQIRDSWYGEGGYGESERTIQSLLREAGTAEISDSLVAVEAQQVEAPADWGDLGSPETYLGYLRSAHMEYTSDLEPGTTHSYVAPDFVHLNHWALNGGWTSDKEAIVSYDTGGSIIYRFHARDLNLVAGPVKRGISVPFRVRIDGQTPGDAHGADADADGSGIISEQRLYQLVRQPLPIVDRQFEIEFLGPGVQALAFTFG